MGTASVQEREINMLLCPASVAGKHRTKSRDTRLGSPEHCRLPTLYPEDGSLVKTKILTSHPSPLITLTYPAYDKYAWVFELRQSSQVRVVGTSSKMPRPLIAL